MSVVGAIRNWVDFDKDLLEKSLRSVAHYAKGRMIDVGCGDKPYAGIFASHVDQHLGVEYEETYRNSMYAKTPTADFICSGDTLPFSDGEFDTVLCTQVMEHAVRPWELFSEIARILRRDGILILTVPFSFRIHAEPFDYYRFTPYALRALCEWNGFDVVQLSPRGGFWMVIGQKLGSYLALSAGRLGGDIQRAGGFGYEKESPARPRYWALPFIIPAILVIASICRALNRVAFNPSDSLGYLLVARKSVQSK
jgi:SAM-dependent methyltransferase